MKLISRVILATGMVFLPHLLQAQISITGGVNNDLAPVRPDTVVQVAADSQGLPLVLPEQVPASGTFWWVMPGGMAIPTPCPPQDLSGAIYQIADGQFLVDETGGQIVVNQRRLGLQAQVTSSLVASAAVSQADALVNLISQVQTTAENQEIQTLSLAMEMDVSGPPIPGDGEGSGGTNSSGVTGYVMPDYGTNLWIAQVTVTSGYLTAIGTNTQAYIQYDILSRTNLLQTDWQTENSIFGSETTNWTPFSVTQNNRTNLFIRLRSGASSDGSGLPDWWELEYFGTNGVNPYGNPAGDGYSNLQKFQSGMNPNVFYTPAAPQGVAVKYNANNNTATLNWLPSPGNVTGYTVKKKYTYIYTTTAQDFSVSANTSTYSDDVSANQPDPAQGGTISVTYTVRANYALGNSALSSAVPLESPSFTGNISGGPQGVSVLTVSAMPANTTAIRLTEVNSFAFVQDYVDAYITNFVVPVSSLSNLTCSMSNIMTLDTNQYVSCYWEGQAIESDGDLSADATLANSYVKDPNSDYQKNWMVAPFYDGSVQLKQNLIFQFRIADSVTPFGFISYTYDATTGYSRPTYAFAPTNYVYAGYYDINNTNGMYGIAGDWPSFNIYRPFEDNSLYRNFAFTADDSDSWGDINTGVQNYTCYYDDYEHLCLQLPPAYQPSENAIGVTALLDANTTQWLATYSTAIAGSGNSENDYFNVGCEGFSFISDGSNEGTLIFPNNAVNYWGLPYVSAKVYYRDNDGNIQNTVLSAGNSLSTWAPAAIFMNAAQPQLQTIEYDFWNDGMYSGPEFWSGNIWTNLPGSSAFSPGKTSDLIIVGTGQIVGIAAFAKMAVINSAYTGVYGYLQQYLDKAYKIDENGSLTTNTTGILSPSGQFLASEPGAAALVTMPDIDTHERGTGIVYAVGMVIDRTQGTNMDGSFNGPNATSSANPAVIWDNNNYDRGHTVDGSDFEQDDLGPIDVAKLPSNQQMFDAFYAIDGQPAIPCTRDLEDYFRLWTPGLAALINVLPANYTVQLKLSGDGQIRIYQAIESDGGTNYLFDEVTASNQVINSASLHVGLLSSTMPIVLNCSSNFNEHFIFCGAHTGSAQVDLQILDGNQNVVADTTAYLQINDIKNMYERWTVGDNPKVAPMTVATNAANDLPSLRAFNYSASTDTNTPYILFVHGWNMEQWEKDRYAEAAYKRLYWQGYKGRFGIFQWPTDNGITGTSSALIHHKNYDNSESNAWASATGLMNLLTQLNTEYSGNVYLMAHSMGNVVAGEALRLAGANQLVNTYVAMQAAISAHCYDPTTPVRSSYEAPDRYANYWTGSSPCYFNGTASAGTYVNFYNTNDYALNKWTLDQDWKPDVGYQYARLSDIFIRGTYTETILNFPNDTYEIFAYADPAWSYALGAQVDVGGIFSTNNQVSLPSVWPADIHNGNNYSAHVWHSAEFRSDNAQRWQFWKQVLVKMKLKLQ
jgi:pimeloyl-ACP methyl ester carboxylesterase